MMLQTHAEDALKIQIAREKIKNARIRFAERAKLLWEQVAKLMMIARVDSLVLAPSAKACVDFVRSASLTWSAKEVSATCTDSVAHLTDR